MQVLVHVSVFEGVVGGFLGGVGGGVEVLELGGEAHADFEGVRHGVCVCVCGWKSRAAFGATCCCSRNQYKLPIRAECRVGGVKFQVFKSGLTTLYSVCPAVIESISYAPTGRKGSCDMI